MRRIGKIFDAEVQAYSYILAFNAKAVGLQNLLKIVKVFFVWLLSAISQIIESEALEYAAI